MDICFLRLWDLRDDTDEEIAYSYYVSSLFTLSTLKYHTLVENSHATITEKAGQICVLTTRIRAGNLGMIT